MLSVDLIFTSGLPYNFVLSYFYDTIFGLNNNLGINLPYFPITLQTP